ncbi:MAG: UvrD-helicase domain-containing protein, partial [Oscillospiraceae bacterium]|nr:UvrD-helicase domain-containing protein [Oscillospiraceae bacterium]
NVGENAFRRQLSKSFSCVIVDEFQDCNKIQSSVFELLGEERLFYVGDVKQSIYSFRGADPYIMAELCDNDNSVFKKLPLNTNFRSRRAVVDTVNAAFTGLMTPRFGGVDYAKDNALNYGADYPEPKIGGLYDTEIAFVRSSSQADDDDEKNMEQARYVAKRIQELVNDEDFLVCDGKDEDDNYIQRRADYSDFIVLLRAGTHINKYRKALAELNIPSTSKSGSGFFEADEIKMAWNFLKIIDNPLLNEEFLKVLMSPIYRFTAEEAAQIKMGLLGIEEADEKTRRAIAGAYKRRSLFSCANDCVTQTARVGNNKINVKRNVPPKLKKFADDLKAFRYHMNSSSLTDLVRKIYEDTDLISIVAAFEDSPRRVGNIRQLQSMAADFEARGGGGLGDFMRFLERAAENSSKGVEEAAQPESNINAVRIMTFHASKGLEAPVCIMSELRKTMNHSDYSNDLLFSFEHYMAITRTDVKRRKKSKLLAHRALKKFIRDRELGSELRLLYVAMTRAQEKLIMVSSISDNGYNKFDSFIDESRPPENEALHDMVYENSAPFMCVLQTLMNFAPSFGCDDKEFYLDGIACKVSAVDPDVKCNGSENEPVDADEIEGDLSPASTKFPEEEIAALTERMNAKYAHLEDTVQQAKYSTTELARESDTKPPILARPSFANGGAPSGADKGNAYHHCMEHFPLESVTAAMNHDALLAAVEKALDEMEKSRKITADELKLIEAERIARFFESDLGKRMLNAYAIDKSNVIREQPFFAEVYGTEVRQDYKGKIGIQGRTDMYFIENGEIVVVDYKSDTIENLKKEQSIYEFQVEIYTKVLGELTGKNVKEMYLYAFMVDLEYKI